MDVPLDGSTEGFAGRIELVVDGVTLRVSADIDEVQLTRMIRAIRAASPLISPAGGLRIYVATRPTDCRKGIDGLALVVQETTGLDPLSGAAFVFRAKRADRITTPVGKFVDRATTKGAVTMHQAALPITMFGHRISKVLVWDQSGIVLVHKHLEGSRARSS